MGELCQPTTRNRYSRSAKQGNIRFSSNTREPPRDSGLETEEKTSPVGSFPPVSNLSRSRLKRILGPRSIRNATASQKQLLVSRHNQFPQSGMPAPTWPGGETGANTHRGPMDPDRNSSVALSFISLNSSQTGLPCDKCTNNLSSVSS